MSEESLVAIPLGGLGEFGMNMMALRYGDDMIVVDAGLMFPEAELLGVDIVIPDISYLRENLASLRAIILTHGHEDHIGSLPYILSELNVPVYGTELTMALVENRLEERNLAEHAQLRTVKPREHLRLGPFEIEFIRVTHSLADCVALAITTPVGIIVHTGDFKIDPTPPDDEHFDLHTLADYGRRGVLALFSDSTNVERPGFTPSERAVRGRFEEIFTRAPGKVLISCFTSSIHRIQLVIDLCAQYRRKLAFVGRSMVQTTGIAHDLGYLEIPDGLLIRPGDLGALPSEKVTVLISGSQGEPMAALSRAAVSNHKFVSLKPEDTVVLSARIIPGNEQTIYRMINHISKLGATVISEDGGSHPVHVSGHASQEELKLVLNLVRPKYFIPIHGEYRQLFRHAQLAQYLKAVGSETILLEDGDTLELSARGAQKGAAVTAGRVLVDGGSLEEVEEVVIRDRQHLAEDGIVLPIIAIDKHTGRLGTLPEIVSRGFVAEDGSRLLAGARDVVIQTIEQSSLEEKTDWTVIKDKIRTQLRRYFSKQVSKRPLILPVILEV